MQKRIIAFVIASLVVLAAASVYAAAYIGNANTYKFHHSWCASVGKMNPRNKVPLESREEATNRGFVPCKRCNP